MDLPQRTKSIPDDLLRLLSYMYRSDKTFSDSVRKKNTAYAGPYCGCEPFFFPREYETDPVMAFEAMMFTVGAFPHDHAISLAKHRIISFHASTGLLPQDLDTLGGRSHSFMRTGGISPHMLFAPILIRPTFMSQSAMSVI